MRARSANSAVSSDQIGRVPGDIFVGFFGQSLLGFKSSTDLLKEPEKDLLKISEKECNVFVVLWTVYYGCYAILWVQLRSFAIVIILSYNLKGRDMGKRI